MRQRAKTIDQVEASDPTFIFNEKDAKAAPAADKRTAPKEFEIERDVTGLYRVKYSAGGEVPDSLKGKFTSMSRAQAAIDNVLTERKQKSGLEQ